MTMKNIIVANWKTAYNLNQIKEISSLSEFKHISLTIIPPFPFIKEARSTLPKHIAVGAQDVSAFSHGLYTGEVTAHLLASCECDTVIIGHSERRVNFNETKIEIKKKIANCVDAKLNVIFCVGEKLDEILERYDIIQKQMEDLDEFPIDRSIIIAYEPVWAIGANRMPDMESVKEMVCFIKTKALQMELNCKVLYGGSVSSDNINSLLSINGLDGYLIGNASIQKDLFAIIRKFEETVPTTEK